MFYCVLKAYLLCKWYRAGVLRFCPIVEHITLLLLNSILQKIIYTKEHLKSSAECIYHIYICIISQKQSLKYFSVFQQIHVCFLGFLEKYIRKNYVEMDFEHSFIIVYKWSCWNQYLKKSYKSLILATLYKLSMLN